MEPTLVHPIRLLDLLFNMTDERIRHLSTTRIHRRDTDSDISGPWTATCSYFRMREWDNPLSHVIPAERPPWYVERRRGSRLTVANTHHLLAVDKESAVGDVESQIRLVNESKLLGPLAVKLQLLPGNKLCEWVVYTHAGDGDERLEWLMSITYQ